MFGIKRSILNTRLNTYHNILATINLRGNMKKLTAFIISALALLVFTTGANAQGATPEETVREVINEMKKAGGPEAMMKYIHWDSALNSMPEAERNELGITSADDLKSFYQTMFTDPTAFMKRRMHKEYSQMTEEQKALIDKQLSQMTGIMKSKIEEQKEKMAKTKFTVGEADISGESATVVVESSLDGQTKQSPVNLIKVDGKWLFPGFQMVNNKPAQAG